MTMLDDDQLTTLFARAAADIELPESGPADIVTRARAAGDGPDDAPEAGEGAVAPIGPGGDPAAPSRWREGRLRRAGAAAAHHRVLTAAACLIVLLAAAGLTGAITRNTSGPTSTSSLRPLGSTVPPRTGAPATTTVPPSSAPSTRARPRRDRRPGAP